MSVSKRAIEILITGANGFIGRELCSRLSSSYELAALDMKKNLDFSGKYHFVECNLTDSTPLKNQINIFPETVIHCAGLAHQKVGTFNRNDYIKINSEATENLAKLASSNNKLHFIFFSTISVYGETDLDQPVSENAEYNPSSDYAYSKLDAERRLIKLYEGGALRKLTILRLAPVYDRDFGLNLERRVFAPKKISYIKFGAGNQTMSALARPNLIEFIDYIIKKKANDNGLQIINVCDAKPYSFHEIIQTFKSSKKYPYRPAIPIPLPAVWAATRIAGVIFKNQQKWFHSCYDKVTSNLVFDNSRMLNTGFIPQHTLQSIFSDK